MPDGWQFKINIYNGYKFYKEPLKVDLWSLKNTNSIIRRKLEPNIENYLTGVPLTIQSIAYDLLEEKVIGNIGLRSLENREISINDFDEIKSYTEKKRITNEDYINGKLTTWNLTGFKNKTICLKK